MEQGLTIFEPDVKPLFSCGGLIRINNEIKMSTIGSSPNKPFLDTGYLLIPVFKVGEYFGVCVGVGIHYTESKDTNAWNIFPSYQE